MHRFGTHRSPTAADEARIPADFRLDLDLSVVRPRPEVLVGGSPLRILRLTRAGVSAVESWTRGDPVGNSPAHQLLARRLVDSGIARPVPPTLLSRGLADVAVVIPVRDRKDGLGVTLASLEATIGETVEVVVVDDGSALPVETETACGTVPIRLVRHQRSRGPAAARNRGWACTSAGVVVFLDADCEPQPGWLEVLLAHFADPAVGAVAPRIRSRPGLGALAEYDRIRGPHDLGPSGGPVRPRTRLSYVPSTCLAVRRSALEEVGGFDEGYRFGEDVDLSWRLHRAGWRVYYEPAGEVLHPPRARLRSWLRQRFDYGTSAAQLAERHGGDVAPAVISPSSGASWLLVAMGRPAGGAAVALASAIWLGKRTGRDPTTARAVARLVLRGHLREGASLAEAIRRAWLPAAIPALAAARSRRSRLRMFLLLGIAFAAAPVARWLADRPSLDLPEWVTLWWADDLAYQAGVWTGTARRHSHRSAAALLPRWTPPRRLRRPPPPDRSEKTTGGSSGGHGRG